MRKTTGQSGQEPVVDQTKVFVTGGSGLVGRNLTEYLQKSGTPFHAPSSAEVNLLDFRSVFDAIEAYKPNLVIHCAGKVGGIAANIAEPYSFCDQNALMGLNLVRASTQLNVEKLLNLGSSCMYPREAKNPLAESSILSGRLEPTNEGYAVAKILVARACEYATRQYGLSYKTLIPCNLYGKYDHFDPERSHMIPGAILKIHNALKNKDPEVTIWGDGTARREFMYAGDLAHFLVHAIDYFGDLPDVMNVGLGYDYTINEYYEAIALVIGYRGGFVHDLEKPAGMNQKLVSIESQTSMGWAPKTSLSQGIQKTYEYFLSENA